MHKGLYSYSYRSPILNEALIFNQFIIVLENYRVLVLYLNPIVFYLYKIGSVPQHYTLE